MNSGGTTHQNATEIPSVISPVMIMSLYSVDQHPSESRLPISPLPRHKMRSVDVKSTVAQESG